eukprot:GHVO01023720.1.p1 GENE.GHVO01023720.1~~GHVO01023720.1.p1  ORF type:complete len:167 (-),score=26.08 GHVO01023720.1:139-600(-)
METLTRARVFTVKDVPADKFIAAFAEHLSLSGKFEVPAWADYVKTGIAKELAPYDPNWMYIRAASILRHVYKRPGAAVGGMRKFYGCRKRRGVAPNRHCLAGGKIIRHCLQQLQSMEYVKLDDKGGRRLTSLGQSVVDQTAKKLARGGQEQEE